jgi:SprT protein
MISRKEPVAWPRHEKPGELDAGRRLEIVKLVGDLYRIAAQHFDCSGDIVPVHFTLRGLAAGQWRLRNGSESLHFNERLFAAAPEQHMPDTVTHEVAHSVVYRRFGQGLRPHGGEWRMVMEQLGCKAQVTHRTPPEILARTLNRPLYRCGCRIHALGPRQHRHAINGRRNYQCRVCGQRLVPADL